ncbi:hypothetical protein BaRGS_00034858 [Batillaria attramentaria]|uniref:Uncharacterized protein n=1 Tax=Batillaria attramentaria TaxID=370345 RepID=A0ABD0JG31_9CAEN
MLDTEIRWKIASEGRYIRYLCFQVLTSSSGHTCNERNQTYCRRRDCQVMREVGLDGFQVSGAERGQQRVGVHFPVIHQPLRDVITDHILHIQLRH